MSDRMTVHRHITAPGKSLASDRSGDVTPLARVPITVLVVDDDPVVREVVTLGLSNRGFAVRSVGTGPEATEVLRRYRDSIDLVLLDVLMQPWDGPRTLAELRTLDPAVPVAFMSGNADRYSTGELLTVGVAAVFDKPFPSLSALADTLGAIVAGK